MFVGVVRENVVVVVVVVVMVVVKVVHSPNKWSLTVVWAMNIVELVAIAVADVESGQEYLIRMISVKEVIDVEYLIDTEGATKANIGELWMVENKKYEAISILQSPAVGIEIAVVPTVDKQSGLNVLRKVVK